MTIDKDKRIFLLLLVWAAAVLMLMSPDSPLHGLWAHTDSAWFYMAGKAWMNGLRPYVDFADSKGPLVWLIYGVGYLLSPRSYTGVYVLSCLFYAGTFWYNFKTARIFMDDDRRSLLVTLLMAFPYFLYWFHFEVRAEDFCNFFVAMSMYCLFRLLYGSGAAAARPTPRRCGLVLGGCFSALLLIKFNIAAMQASMVGIALWHCLWNKEKSSMLKWVVAGAVAVALPFVAYFLVTDTFGAFVQEYFINTLGTVSSEGGYQKSFFREMAEALSIPAPLVLLLVIIYGGWLIGRQQRHYRYIPLSVGVFFFMLATIHKLPHYYSICSIFVIYLMIDMVKSVTRPLGNKTLVAAVAGILAWGIYENVRIVSQLNIAAVWTEKDSRTVYEEISQIMSGVDKPLILNLGSNEQGYGISQGALPAGKYWAYQLGSTHDMTREHLELLRSGKADFVIVFDEETMIARCGITSEDIMNSGYVMCYIKEYPYVLNSKVRIKTVVYKKVKI